MNERERSSEHDATVSAHYRAASEETTPAHLDEAVLRDAASDAARDRWQFRYHPWLRPIAVAATIALSFAVLLEVTAPTSNGPTVIDDFSSAASDATDRIRDIGETATASRPPGDPTVTSTPQAAPGDDPARFCDDDDTASPESWWDCIVTLREGGREAEADAEWRRLEIEYPGFSPER